MYPVLHLQLHIGSGFMNITVVAAILVIIIRLLQTILFLLLLQIIKAVDIMQEFQVTAAL